MADNKAKRSDYSSLTRAAERDLAAAQLRDTLIKFVQASGGWVTSTPGARSIEIFGAAI